MGFPIFYNGSILFRDGKPAFSINCCCGNCCTFTGDETITGVYGTFGDIEMNQSGAGTYRSGATGRCNADNPKFTVVVTLLDQLSGTSSYTTTATISLLGAVPEEGCRWLMEIPQDPMMRTELEHSGSFIAGPNCGGLQTVNDPIGEPNGWGFGEFVVTDPDGSTTGEKCLPTVTGAT